MATTRALSDSEQSALLQELDRARDQLLVRFGLHTGFRISELLRLTLGDVWHAGAPRRELTIARRRLKGGAGAYRRRIRSRTVPLHPSLQAALEAYVHEAFPLGDPPPDAVLFKSREGDNRAISYPQAYRLIKAAARALGDPSRIAWHSTRKSFVRGVYDGSNHDLVLTQRVVGHSSVLTTSRYLETTDDQLAAAVLGLRPAPALATLSPNLPAPLHPAAAA